MTLFARNGGQSATLRGVNASSGPITVTLQQSASIAGRVVPGDRKPVQNFTVSLVMLDSHGPAQFGTNGGTVFAGDRFLLEDVPAEHVMIRVTTDDGRQGTAMASLTPGSAQSIDVTLISTGRVVGRVVDVHTSAPITRGGVIVGGAGASLGPDGHFDISAAPAGMQRVQVFAPGVGSTEVEVEIEPGETVDLGDIPLGAG
jgi:hypothetical protein